MVLSTYLLYTNISENEENDGLGFLVAKDYIPNNNVVQKAVYYIVLILFAVQWIQFYIY